MIDAEIGIRDDQRQWFREMEGGFEFDFSGLGNCEGSKLPGFISVQNSGSGFQ